MKVKIAIEIDVADDRRHCGRCSRLSVETSDWCTRFQIYQGPQYPVMSRKLSNDGVGPLRCDECLAAEVP